MKKRSKGETVSIIVLILLSAFLAVSFSCCQHVQAGKNGVDGIVDYRGDPAHDPVGHVGVEKYKE